MVYFIEASPLRYALTVKPTVYVSHIRQFWFTARIKTTEEGTQVLATVDGVLRTVTESSLRRNLKLKDEDGIYSLPDTELFENLTLMGYNISPNQKFTFQKGQFSHQWKYLIHTIMQCLSLKSTGFNKFSSNIATALVCLATNRTYNFSKMIFDGLVKNVNNKGEGSDTPTEPHHIPSPVAQPPSHTTHSSSTLSPVTTTSIPTVNPSETTLIRQYTRRDRIAQSSALPTIADEPKSPLRDVSQGEACPTDSGWQPLLSPPPCLMIQHQGLQRQHSELLAKFQAQEVEINRLKERVKLLEDKEGVAAEGSGDDAPIKGRNLDEGKTAPERASDDTKEMATVLTSMDAATVLASGAAEVPTGSRSIPTAGPPTSEVPTGSDVVPTASLVFATTTMVTLYRRRKGKEVMGMTFEEVEAKFNSVWKQMEDFIPMGSKEEAKRIKRKGLGLEQESAKKQNTSEEVTKEAKSLDEVPKEKVTEMMQLVPIEEVYVEALQVKHPIID
uniref:Synaptobrevin, longin-like domain protein n=1 Tax=Tanacetum cinerariifolium TaxID=118510 RepID=A0A6L2K3X9_TANCI|nr:synaptobrevin, longin-like domain protein [Tanacetum cinerariifolium]